MKIFVLILICPLFLLSGCASLNDLVKEVTSAKKDGNGGVAKIYPVNINQAWDITEAVFRWEKTDEIEEHRNENYVITSTGMKMVAFGSVMGIWIEPVDPNNTRVTVITKRRIKDIFTRLTTSTFHERFEQGIDIVKRGEPLPLSPPKTERF